MLPGTVEQDVSRLVRRFDDGDQTHVALCGPTPDLPTGKTGTTGPPDTTQHLPG